MSPQEPILRQAPGGGGRCSVGRVLQRSLSLLPTTRSESVEPHECATTQCAKKKEKEDPVCR